MNSAWRTVIHIGFAAWRSIWKTLGSHDQRIAAFKSTWASTATFCSFRDAPTWNFIPDPDFLPKNLATRPSTNNNRGEIPTPTGQASLPSLRSGSTEAPCSSHTFGHDVTSMSQEGSEDVITRAGFYEDSPVNLADFHEEGALNLQDANSLYNRQRAVEEHAEDILRRILLDIDQGYGGNADNDEPGAGTPQELDFDFTTDIDIQNTFRNIYRDIIEDSC